MSDLISKSAVIDVLKETGIIQDNDLGHLVVDEIERIPTAYNVDKVVEELEEKAKDRRNRAYMIPNAEVNIFAQYLLGMSVVLEDVAIEIVKGGGVNDNIKREQIYSIKR